MTIEDDEGWRENPTGEHPKAKPSTGRPPLRVVASSDRDGRVDISLTSKVHETTEHMIDALRIDPELYVRGGLLAHVIRASDATPGMREGSPMTRTVPLSWLIDRVSRFSRCLVRKTKKNGDADWVPCPPPSTCVRAVLESGEWKGIRELVAVSETPFMRPDGTVCQEPGYDPATGFLYEPNADYPRVEDSPSKEAAAEALGALLDVFVDFPYVNPAHALVPIAAILSVLARPAIDGPVPAFAFDASTRGSGKTLQCDVISAIASGRTAARANYPEKDEELEKALGAYAVAGARMILLDNVTRTLGGGPLDAVLTCRDEVEFRLLGRTEIRRLPWRAILMVSGNNITLGEDTARRCLVARLESPLESPEERADFAHPNLIEWVTAERPRLVHAALTVLRAYAVAGSPDVECGRWGSFEAWSTMIPSAIVFANGTNPMIARATQSAAMSDSKRSLSALIEGLNKLAPTNGPGGAVVPISARTIIASLYPERDAHDGPREPDAFEDLRDAIEQETGCPQGRRPEARRLGKWLQRVRGRVINGWLIDRIEGANHTACWRAAPSA